MLLEPHAFDRLEMMLGFMRSDPLRWWWWGGGINGGWIQVLKVWFEVLQGKDSSLPPIHTV